jgi:peptidylprolyl isomerase
VARRPLQVTSWRVLYVGVSWRAGEQFDAFWDRGNTFKFGLGKGQVIAGWDQGVTA